jgi:hypothetical protein
VKKTKRTALSWDPAGKERVSDLKFALRDEAGKEMSNGALFKLCLGYGFQARFKGELPPKNSDAVRLSYLQPADFAMFRAVAMRETKNPEVILEEDEVLDIVERYAAGGLSLLVAALDSESDFQQWLTSVLWKVLDKAKSD